MSQNRGILFTIVNGIAIILLPLCIIISILYVLLTTPVFYTTILKRIDIVGTFVKAKILKLHNPFRKKLIIRLALHHMYWHIRQQKTIWRSQKAYDIINKTEEYENYKTAWWDQNLSYSDVKQAFPNKQSFENNQIRACKFKVRLNP